MNLMSLRCRADVRWLEKRLPEGPDRQHRAGGMANNLLGYAAEEEAIETGKTVCRHDDEIAACFFREVNDLRVRAAGPDVVFDLRVGVTRFRKEALEV